MIKHDLILSCCFVLFSLLFTLSSIAQKAETISLFTLSGKMMNSAGKIMTIAFTDEDGFTSTDTIALDKSGHFSFQTSKVRHPQFAKLALGRAQIMEMMVVPGYNLILTGDAESPTTLFQSMELKGIGAESNYYQFLLDSITNSPKYRVRWYELSMPDLLVFISEKRRLIDSLVQAVFDRPSNSDPFLQQFGSLIRRDNQFNELNMLLYRINMDGYPKEVSDSLLKAHIGAELLLDIYENENLLLPSYRSSVIGGRWLDYQLGLDYEKDSSLGLQEYYWLRKIDQSYKGKAKEYILHKKFIHAIEHSETLEELMQQDSLFSPFISQIYSAKFRQDINEKFGARRAALLKTQIEMQAPNFTAIDSTGRIYSLQQFRGKLLFLDLWASSCTPCREEVPFLRSLYEKYKLDDRVQFIGIAVSDRPEPWRKALQKDRPPGVQLFDSDGNVDRSFFVGFIPRYVLIDREGKIVHFSMPAPSSGLVERLIDEALSKWTD